MTWKALEKEIKRVQPDFLDKRPRFVPPERCSNCGRTGTLCHKDDVEAALEAYKDCHDLE